VTNDLTYLTVGDLIDEAAHRLRTDASPEEVGLAAIKGKYFLAALCEASQRCGVPPPAGLHVVVDLFPKWFLSLAAPVAAEPAVPHDNEHDEQHKFGGAKAPG